MSRLRIHRCGLSPEEIQALLKLLESAGIDPEIVEFIDAVSEPDDGCDDEVILFLLSPGACGTEETDADVTKVPDGGRRAICVWPEDSPEESTPPTSAMKFAYSIVPWNPEKLRIVLNDDDVTCFETPSGKPLPVPETERLECP